MTCGMELQFKMLEGQSSDPQITKIASGLLDDAAANNACDPGWSPPLNDLSSNPAAAQVAVETPPQAAPIPAFSPGPVVAAPPSSQALPRTSSVSSASDGSGPEAPLDKPWEPPTLSQGNGGYSVYIASDSTFEEARKDWNQIKSRVKQKSPGVTVYVMHPSRLPCWWGLAVAYDLQETDALKLRDTMRDIGFRSAFITKSLSADASKSACPDAWREYPR